LGDFDGGAESAIGGRPEILRLSFWSFCEDLLPRACDVHAHAKEILDDHDQENRRFHTARHRRVCAA
jgi:hypothetical protein